MELRIPNVSTVSCKRASPTGTPPLTITRTRGALVIINHSDGLICISNYVIDGVNSSECYQFPEGSAVAARSFCVVWMHPPSARVSHHEFVWKKSLPKRSDCYCLKNHEGKMAAYSIDLSASGISACLDLLRGTIAEQDEALKKFSATDIDETLATARRRFDQHAIGCTGCRRPKVAKFAWPCGHIMLCGNCARLWTAKRGKCPDCAEVGVPRDTYF